MILALFVVLLVLFVVFPVVGLAWWAIVSTIIVGLVIGAVARLVLPGRRRVGLLVTLLGGLIGAFVGGFLGNHVFGVGWIGTTLLEIAVAAVAIALLVDRRSGHRLGQR